MQFEFKIIWLRRTVGTLICLKYQREKLFQIHSKRTIERSQKNRTETKERCGKI
jgi:hypothetical protein